jgi:hypothetical protein
LPRHALKGEISFCLFAYALPDGWEVMNPPQTGSLKTYNADFLSQSFTDSGSGRQDLFQTPFAADLFYPLGGMGLIFRIKQRHKRIVLGITEALFLPLANFRLMVIRKRSVKTVEL